MLTSWKVAKLGLNAKVAAHTWTEQFLNAFRSDSADPARPLQRIEVQEVARFAKNHPISGVGGHDSCRGRLSHRESVFSEENQQHLPGLFFPLPSIFPCTKAAVTGSTGGLHLSQGLKVRALLLMWPPPPTFRSPSWKHYSHFPLTEFHLLMSLYLALIFSGASASTLRR